MLSPMRWAWALPFLLAGHAAAAGFGFLEMRVTGKGDGSPVPLYLVYPDTLGSVPVRFFLEAPEDKVQGAMAQGAWTSKPVSKGEKEFLVGLRALAQGRFNDARDLLAAAGKHLPR